MGEVLSQNEIDALLSALSSGDLNIEEHSAEEKQKIRKYDFKRPNKFSKEHIRTIEMVHDNFARIASNYLTAHLRSSVQIKAISTEQITFEEFIHSIPNPTILISFFLEPFTGLMLFETGPQFVFQIVDILFGGNGKNSVKIREFTDIEKNIMKKINLKLLENLKMAWEDILDVEVKFENLETNPVLNQVMAPNESVALVTMSVEIGHNQCFLNMCIPYISVEKYIDKLIIQYKTSITEKDDIEIRNKMENNLMGVKVDTFAELGKNIITVEDFLSLNIGDCIPINRKLNESIDYYIEKAPHFKVYPGTIGKKVGVQVSKIIDKDVENNA